MFKEDSPPKPHMFIEDHPFVFAIQDDESGALVYGTFFKF